MKKRKVEELKRGLYRIYWKGGGYSLASVGIMHNGDRWMAPVNWTAWGGDLPGTTDRAWWKAVSRVEAIELVGETHARMAESDAETYEFCGLEHPISIGHIYDYNAKWCEGMEGTITIKSSTPNDVFISIAEGRIAGFHFQDFLSFDMQSGDRVSVVNDPILPHRKIANLNDLLVDAINDSLTDRYFSFVLGIVAGNPHCAILNLPSGSFASASEAFEGVNKYSVYRMPSMLSGRVFLIARFSFRHQSAGGRWTLEHTEDLRGMLY